MDTLMHSASGVGDVRSSARGSGARFNTGKAPYELLPLKVVTQWVELANPQLIATPALEVIKELAEWQSGSNIALGRALISATNSFGDMSLLADAAHVFDYGRKKYAEWNWAKGMAWSIPLACAVRHCLAILRGEETDPESGQPHMGHVKCNILMLMLFAETYPEGDDRPVAWLRAP